MVELTGYRDLAAVFRERVELFPPQTLPAFAEAVSNLTLFAGGLDLEEQILPGLSPWVRLVVRPVPFDPGAEPELPLPAAAAIVELTDPQLGPVLVGAFQTAIGLVNVDRAQKSEDGMLLGLSLEGEVQITSARFHPPLPGDGVDVRYNLEPACAVVGRHFILGTHRALVAELAEGQPDWKEADLRVLGPAVSRVIAANFEALVVQNMLDHGNTRERAEGNVRFLQTALALVRELTIEVAHPAGDRVDVVLRADLVR